MGYLQSKMGVLDDAKEYQEKKRQKGYLGAHPAPK
jgi:hypothetical protein